MQTPPFFYNYFNNDTLMYQMVRLYGQWSNPSGTLSVELNGSNLPGSWRYCNYDFKVFVRMNQQSNNIILRDVLGGTKQINLFYRAPQFSSTLPVVKFFLYDAYDGDGTCDTPPVPPYCNTNTLEYNIKRLQLDALLLQSFFAESLKAAREYNEGFRALPYSTFPIELDASNNPKVYYCKNSNSFYTRDRYLRNNWLGSVNAENVIPNICSDIRTPFAGREIFYLGYSLISRQIPGGVYYGRVNETTSPIGMINSGNLIWHPLNEWNIQDVADNYSNIDRTYNVLDGVNTNQIQEQYFRILGSLLHVSFHCLYLIDHPEQIIGLVHRTINSNANPLRYTFPFDIEKYANAYGLDANEIRDANYLRYWFMPYNSNYTRMSHILSELGPTGRGWISQFTIQGYVRTVMTLDNSITEAESDSRFGIVNNRITQNLPPYTYPQNNWQIYRTPGYHSLRAPNKPTYCIAYLYGNGATNMSSFHKSKAAQGGAGGFVKVVFPVNANDTINISIGNNIGDNNSLLGNGGMGFIAEQGGAPPYGGYQYGLNGPGYNAIYLSNICMAIAPSGGVAGKLGIIGITPYQFIKNSQLYDGESGYLPNKRGMSAQSYQDNVYNLRFQPEDQSLITFFQDILLQNGGGAGYNGGSVARAVNTPSNPWNPQESIYSLGGNTFSSGAGTAFVNKYCTHSIIKGGIPGVEDYEKFRKPLAIRRILPSLFYSPPANIGNSGQIGAVILNFLEVDPYKWSNYNFNAWNSLSPTYIPLGPTNLADTFTTADVTISPRVALYQSCNSYITLCNTSTKITYTTNGTVSDFWKRNLSNHVNAFHNDILNCTGINTIELNYAATCNCEISLVLDTADTSLEDTENKYFKYRINIQSNFPQIEVRGATVAAISHGTASLIQQLRIQSNSDVQIGTCLISDYSTCIYSGILIDPARDPLGYDYMLNIFDVMRYYKMNKLHVHGTDDGGYRFPLSSNSTSFTYSGIENGNVLTTYSLERLIDTDAKKHWFSSNALWSNYLDYGEGRGITITPELELLGHSKHLRNIYPNIFGRDEHIVDYYSELAYIGITVLLSNIITTFPNAEFIYLGTDEADLGTINTSPYRNSFMTRNPHVTNIAGFAIYRLNNYVRSFGRRSVTWQNANFSNINGNTSNNIVTQTWLINGGQGPPMIDKSDLHGTELLPWFKAGISLIQTPWKPQRSTRHHGMWDWHPSCTLFTSSNINENFPKTSPLPVNSNLLGSITLLWEYQPHIYKPVFLRYSAAMRAENTVSMTKNSISWYNTYTNYFPYLDNRLMTISCGIRLVEEGLSADLGYLYRTNADDSQIPYIRAGYQLRLTLINNRPDTYMKYAIGYLFSYPSLATMCNYTGPITLDAYDIRANNGLLNFKVAAYNSSTNIQYGQYIDKNYIFMPFNVIVSGTYKVDDLEYHINLNEYERFYFDTYATLWANILPGIPQGSLHFSFTSNITPQHPILTNINQLKITSSTNIMSIAYFDTQNNIIGSIYTATLIYNGDLGESRFINGGIIRTRAFYGGPSLISESRLGSSSNPANSYTIQPRYNFRITSNFYYSGSGSSTQLRLDMSNILGTASNVPSSVRMTVLVVAGGGNGSAIANGGGGGSGGVSIETYHSIQTYAKLDIQVGGPQCNSFVSIPLSNYPLNINVNQLEAGTFRPIITDRDDAYKKTNPIYPTVCWPGIPANTSNAGIQGGSTLGDYIILQSATNGSGSSTPGIGGGGYNYMGSNYGAGGSGGSGGGNTGRPGLVSITIEPLDAPILPGYTYFNTTPKFKPIQPNITTHSSSTSITYSNIIAATNINQSSQLIVELTPSAPSLTSNIRLIYNPLNYQSNLNISLLNLQNNTSYNVVLIASNTYGSTSFTLPIARTLA